VDVSGGFSLSCRTTTVVVVTTPLLVKPLLEKPIPGSLVGFGVRVD
jgi:hypothetical protein